MKVAFIPPVAHLDATYETDLQLMLPELLGDPDYRKTYEDHLSNPNQYVIMDNGAAEAAQPSNEELVAIADDLFPQELAIPDVLADGDATVARATEFLTEYGEYFLYETPTKLGLVAQGKSVEEAVQTVKTVLHHSAASAIKTIYIPRLLIGETMDPDARLKVAVDLMGMGLDLHLFGVSHFAPQEVRKARHYSFIRSVDTSFPFVAAGNYTPIHNARTAPSRPDFYFDQVFDQVQEACMWQNVQEFKRWANA